VLGAADAPGANESYQVAGLLVLSRLIRIVEIGQLEIGNCSERNAPLDVRQQDWC
jgi:hypothetical protein